MEIDPVQNIVNHLCSKSSIKQRTYKHLTEAFTGVMAQCRHLVKEINKQIKSADENVTVNCKKISDREFHVKVAGDLLVFVLHTNIVTLDDKHAIINSPYVQEDVNRRYFGQIMIYNFMADSVKYNRLQDPGYLIGRILLNYENHFFIEGEGQLNFLFREISAQPLSSTDIDIVVKLAITEAAQNDLVTPPFHEIRFITLDDKINSSQSLGAGQKIGFKMSYQNNVK